MPDAATNAGKNAHRLLETTATTSLQEEALANKTTPQNDLFNFADEQFHRTLEEICWWVENCLPDDRAVEVWVEFQNDDSRPDPESIHGSTCPNGES